MKEEDKKSEGLEKILGEPVIDDFSESAHRVRRNLIVFSTVALFYRLSGAKIGSGGIELYGVKFEDIDEKFITIWLSLIVIYHFMHFALIVLGHLKYLQIRLTKSDVKFRTGAFFSSQSEDHPSDPKHSTLYSWWTEQSRILNQFLNQEKIENFITLIEAEKLNDDQKSEVAMMQGIRNSFGGIEQGLKEMNKILGDKRIKESLERFDQSFNCYRGVEKVRWILVEMGFPLILGLSAFFVL